MRFGSDDFLFSFGARGTSGEPFTFRFLGKRACSRQPLSFLGRHVSGFEGNVWLPNLPQKVYSLWELLQS